MLLQGDELSVQLFIGAAALTALSVAMTQAGWTHKWFVRGMFALAALLTISSIGWPSFETKIPRLSGALQAIAASRLGWFLVGIIPAFIGGMLLNDWLRQRRQTAKTPTKWVSVFDARRTLARQDLIDRNEYVIKEAAGVAVMKQTTEEELSNLYKQPDPLASLGVSERAQEYVRLQKRINGLKEEWEGWMVTEEDCRSALCSNIQHQLRRGSLVAKGFLAPHVPGAVEMIIPTEEWRFLSLDCDADQALGPNFEYIALVIGRPNA